MSRSLVSDRPLRCLDDVDDEVRDRAAMYLRMFKESLLADTYVKEGESTDLLSTRGLANRIPESVFSLDALESKLVSYVNDPSASASPFDASSVPKISRAQAASEAARRFPLGASLFFSTHSMHRAKFTGNRWCPSQEGDYAYTATVCSGDSVSVHSTT